MSESRAYGSKSGSVGEQDLESFGNLVEKTLGAVYALAFAGLGTRETAEDLTCDVFLRAWLNRNHPNRTYPSSFWIAGMVRELAREWFDEGQIRSPLLGLLRLGPPADEVDESGNAQEKFAASQFRRQLERQIRLLAVPAREVVMLRIVAGRSNEEVAKLIGLPDSAVELLLKEARATLEAQSKIAGAPAQLLGPPDDLLRRTLAAIEAADNLNENARASLMKTASIERLMKKRRNRTGDTLMQIFAPLGNILVAPFRLFFGFLHDVLGGRGTGVLLAISFFALLTLYIAYLSGGIPARLEPFTGPTPPASVLQMRPYVYNGTAHRQNVDRRSLLAEAAQESSGQLVAYLPKDYGVLIAVRWNDGRTHLTGVFTGKVDVIGVASIQQDPESLELAVRSPDRLDQPYTAWFLITY